ncbi:MAG: hypothetical protein ACRERU_07140 [Methylococcales bacterium]
MNEEERRGGRTEVVLVDVDISIASLTVLLVKLAIASIPAAIIFGVLWLVAWPLLVGFVSAVL